jgi:hypothetical protein
LDSDPQFKDGFKHPDPLQNNRIVSFCEYWREQWYRKDTQKMLSPDPNAASNPQLETPFGWLRTEFPSKTRYKEELVNLQKHINSPAKANVSV